MTNVEKYRSIIYIVVEMCGIYRYNNTQINKYRGDMKGSTEQDCDQVFTLKSQKFKTSVYAPFHFPVFWIEMGNEANLKAFYIYKYFSRGL